MTEIDHIYIALEGGNIISLATTLPAHIVIVDYGDDSDEEPVRVTDGANSDFITLDEFKEWVSDAKEEEAKGKCIGPLSWGDMSKVHKKLTGRTARPQELWEWAKGLPGLFYFDKEDVCYLRREVL